MEFHLCLVYNVILRNMSGNVTYVSHFSRTTEEKPNEPPPPRPKGFRPLYDIPWMFEAREFLRKKLIGKKVNVVVDYIQTAKDNFPEKVCCTVTIGGV